MNKPEKLRKLFSEGKLIRVMGAHNGLSVKLAEFVGKILAAKNAQ